MPTLPLRTACVLVVIVLFGSLPGRTQVIGRSWYAAPAGSADGDGTRDSPLDLRTALSKSSPVRPGDALWLRGGVYRGSFNSFLRGTAAAPIVVREEPGERAIIDSNDGTRDAPDGAFNLRADGGYAWYWGFEVMNSDPLRTSADAGAFPTDLYRANGVNVYASNVKLINLVIHDVENGVFVGDMNRDVELYGLISYYNGHDAPTMAWGHGIYVQNLVRTDPRVVQDTITASNFSHGLHAYGGSDRGLNAIHLEGNISFQNGVLSKFHLVRNLLLGGLSVAADAVVVNNYTYYSRPDGENNIGYSAGAPGAIVNGNYFIGGRRSLVWAGPGRPATLAGNVLYGLTTPATIATDYPSNTYVGAQKPTAMRSVVRGNKYEPGRAHIVIYNWSSETETSVDLSSARLKPGARFEIRDVQDYFGPPVVTGTYDGKRVTIPLKPRAVAPPVGSVPVPAHTLPEFGVFVVTPVTARAR